MKNKYCSTWFYAIYLFWYLVSIDNPLSWGDYLLLYLHFPESWLPCPIYSISIVFTIWNTESIFPAFWGRSSNRSFHQESKYGCISIHRLGYIWSRSYEFCSKWNIDSNKWSIFSISLDEVEFCSFINIENSKYIKIFYEFISICFFEGMSCFESDSIFILASFDFSCFCSILSRDVAITLISWYWCPYRIYPIWSIEFPWEFFAIIRKKAINLAITRSKENLPILYIVIENLEHL